MIAAITNRERLADGTFGRGLAPADRSGGRHFLLGTPEDLEVVSAAAFRRHLLKAHGVVGWVHGFNNSLEDSLQTIQSLGPAFAPEGYQAVGFAWPSNGRLTDYRPDRIDARGSAPALARTLLEAVEIQRRRRGKCHSLLGMVAHSMGSYVLASAAQVAWEEMGRPQALPLLEVCLIAADLDDDLRKYPGLLALSRRITVYYSRADRALMVSAVKHGWQNGQRLGRTGPASPLPQVVGVDITEQTTERDEIPHSAGLWNPAVQKDVRQALAGVDRELIRGRASYLMLG